MPVSRTAIIRGNPSLGRWRFDEDLGRLGNARTGSNDKVKAIYQKGIHNFATLPCPMPVLFLESGAQIDVFAASPVRPCFM